MTANEPETLELDSLEPDYTSSCRVCGEEPQGQPTVTGWRYGRLVVHWGMCGPCLFGETAMVDPRNWNE
jgi:hypothetical protein